MNHKNLSMFAEEEDTICISVPTESRFILLQAV